MHQERDLFIRVTEIYYGPTLTTQHVGQLRGSLEGFCAYHVKLRDFFALLLQKPNGVESLFEGEWYTLGVRKNST
jgi:hypothetical protein